MKSANFKKAQLKIQVIAPALMNVRRNSAQAISVIIMMMI
jgi:hypothetical protein